MYDAIIVANGEIPLHKYWEDIPFRTLMCTDGAAIPLTQMGLNPGVIIGDLDSIAENSPFSSVKAIQQRFPQSKIIQLHDQNTTDFEKALDFARQQKFIRVLCLGLLGKSADHATHNLSLLHPYSAAMEIMVLNIFEDQYQWIFALDTKTSIYTKKNAIISFFPLPQAIISSQGLQWELQGTPLRQGGMNSMRNKTLQDTVKIECEGECVCFLTAKDAPRVTYLK